MSSKTSVELVFDLINSTNSGSSDIQTHPLSADNVTLGTPAVNDNGAVSKNTKLTLTAVDAVDYQGSVEVYYDRVDLSDILALQTPELELGSEVNISDTLTKINTLYNSNIQAIDIVDGALPAADGNGWVTFTLTAATDSYVYLGSGNLTLKPAAQLLSDAITTTNLSGLTMAQVTD